MYFIYECEAREKEKGKGNINTRCMINDAKKTSERYITMFIRRELRRTRVIPVADDYRKYLCRFKGE